jgi:hypothetical protein
MKMKVYIAGSFSAQLALRDVRDLMVPYVDVTSSWLDEPTIEAHEGDRADWEKRARGNEDYLDIERSDAVAVFTSVPSTSGGLHLETGLALAMGKRVIVVGPRGNVFHYMNRIEHALDVQDLLVTLGFSLPSPYNYQYAARGVRSY